MSTRSPEVDAYISAAPEFARPILEKIRDAFHAGCPAVEEHIKWGVPSFEYRGMLGGMAAFKKHVGFGFWKAKEMSDPRGLFGGAPKASPMRIRAESLGDLPPKSVLVSYVREARRINEQAPNTPRSKKTGRAARITVPPDLAAALAGDTKARETFAAFPPSAKRDYVEWITGAKRDATRARRLSTTIEWLREGKRRNWKYETKCKR